MFDGNDDYVNINDSSVLSLNSANDYTWEFWVNSTDLGEEWNAVWWQGSDANNYFMIFAHTIDDTYWGTVNNGLSAGWTNGGSMCSQRNSVDNYLSPNEWGHVAVTYDASKAAGSRIDFYINGRYATESRTNTQCSPASINPDTIWIGNDSEWPDEEFKGMVDNFRYYNYLRTPAQIAWDYNKGAPIAHWTFDECSGGTIYDQSRTCKDTGDCNNGQLYLGTTGVTATGTCASSSDSFWYNGKDGKVNHAGSFDGVSDYLSILGESDFDFEYNDPFSISVWVKRDTANTLDQIIEKLLPSGSWPGLSFYLPGSDVACNNCVRMDINTDTFGYNFTAQTADNAISTGVWYHIVVTYDGIRIDNHDTDCIKIYINGVTQNLITSEENLLIHSILNDNDVLIGYDPDGYYFDGKIDDVKIWNYALTPEQVKQEYNGGAVKFGN